MLHTGMCFHETLTTKSCKCGTSLYTLCVTISFKSVFPNSLDNVYVVKYDKALVGLLPIQNHIANKNKKKTKRKSVLF